MNETVETLRAAHEKRMTEKEVLSIAYHRNGVCGDGFYVALVRTPDAEQRVLTVIVPEWAVEAGDWQKASEICPSGCVPCYVIDPELASGPWTKPGTVEFGVNSWRGDHYFAVVVAAHTRAFAS